ncbi:MAG TPA: sulfite oxidase [Dehalococcoidia bacterium]|nr:sulfite oxidase [Dehalococcoidia bacterium]
MERTAADPTHDIPMVGDGGGLEVSKQLYEEELALALRNHALPLEGLRYDVTPTGMHYTLVHYDIPAFDASSWRLEVSGRVRTPLRLGLPELQSRPRQTLRVTLECAGDGRALLDPRPLSQPWLTGAVGTAEWTGTPLAPLLAEAGLADDAVDLVFTGHDHGIEGGVEQDYQRSLSRQEALQDGVLLAWAMNGALLEPQHGAPLRLIAPGWYGMAHVKWLRSIAALDAPFTGYQQSVAYRYNQNRAEAGEAVTLMRVRSLMIPPGVPDFLTRMRFVKRGPVELRGRAWSGRAAITGVDISTDGGFTWAAASLDKQTEPYAWQEWGFTWEVGRPGIFELCCRAQDAAGNVQPLDQFWTARGMGNNQVQRVRVQVI